MVLADVVSNEKRSVFMLCNEAIVRGAIEADVKVAAFYPGAPTSEVLDTFSDAADYFDYHMEISANEKVALEVCAGAAFAGLRSLTAMKSVGLNVASDTLLVLGYTGVRGGLVIVVADDPHAHSSQTEQDGRFYAPAAYIPMLEPSSPQEAKDMVKKAFEISEAYRIPVILRTVTRVNHQSGIVQLEDIKRTPYERVSWSSLNEQYITLGAVAREKKLKMLERVHRIAESFEKSEFNTLIEADTETGIVTASVAYLYVLEALRMLGLESKVKVLKLGTTYPIPKRLLGLFLKKLRRVIVVEELSPFIEKEVCVLAKEVNPKLEVYGKLSNTFSEAWEFNPDIVAEGLASTLKLPYATFSERLHTAQKLKMGLPDRYPTFCAGCPHRATFVALNQALKIQASKGMGHYFATDIGCYSMWVFPPISHADSSLCMGASVGIANGLAHAIMERPVAVVGDSTFFHAAIPGIVNAVHNGNKFTLIVLDNSVTAMTGQQSNPSTEQTAGGKLGKKVSIEAVCRAIGVEFVEVVDAYDVKNNVEIFRKALEFNGLAVVVSRRECALYADRNKRRKGFPITPYSVDKAACKRLYTCLRTFYCPAYELDEDRQPRISPELCDGCGVCSSLCPLSSIKQVKA
jgi:indolepyruvate ferredoxin oxidoreductase alpha subunit